MRVVDMKGDRGQISIRGDTYERLKVCAERRGVSVSTIVEAAIGTLPDPEAEQYEPEPFKPPPAPVDFFCASCGNDRHGTPYRLPWGRDNGIVDVCVPCVEEHPRSGRATFSAAGKPSGGSVIALSPGSRKPGR